MFFFVPVEFSDISTMNMDYSGHQRKHGILKECRGHSGLSVVGGIQNQEWKHKAQLGGCCSPSEANYWGNGPNWRWRRVKLPESMKGRDGWGGECRCQVTHEEGVQHDFWFKTQDKGLPAVFWDFCLSARLRMLLGQRLLCSGVSSHMSSSALLFSVLTNLKVGGLGRLDLSDKIKDTRGTWVAQ